MPKQPPMIRLLIPFPPALLKLMGACIPAGQSRAEWIRECIRQRISRESPK